MIASGIDFSRELNRLSQEGPSWPGCGAKAPALGQCCDKAQRTLPHVRLAQNTKGAVIVLQIENIEGAHSQKQRWDCIRTLRRLIQIHRE